MGCGKTGTRKQRGYCCRYQWFRDYGTVECLFKGRECACNNYRLLYASLCCFLEQTKEKGSSLGHGVGVYKNGWVLGEVIDLGIISCKDGYWLRYEYRSGGGEKEGTGQ